MKGIKEADKRRLELLKQNHNETSDEVKIKYVKYVSPEDNDSLEKYNQEVSDAIRLREKELALKAQTEKEKEGCRAKKTIRGYI